MKDMKNVELTDLDTVAGGSPISYGPSKYSTTHQLNIVQKIADAISEAEEDLRNTLLPHLQRVVA